MPTNLANKLRYAIAHPVTWFTGTFGGILAAIHPPTVAALWDALLASAGPLFSALTISALTIEPRFPPETPTEWAIVALGGLVVLASLIAAKSKINKHL